MYTIEQQVLFQAQRCQCSGGGFTEMVGTIVGTITNQSGQWYQINTTEGIKTVREEWIKGEWQ